jgi:hypothetical protein
MAQRNPMNQRYAGDGPKGQTRKSAAKLKPKSEAAASVHIDKKPVTKSERKAAHKKREKELLRKEQERVRKAAERAQAEKEAKIAAGELPPEPEGKKAKRAVGDKSILQKVKDFFIDDTNKKKTNGTNPNVPQTPEYKKYKKIYWILMAVGIASVVVSFLMQFAIPGAMELMDGTGWMIPMGLAYVSIIAAIVLDYAKIRRLTKAHVAASSSGKKSPKQMKHEERKAATAQRMEASKKAQKELKRANSKIPFVGKSGAAEPVEADVEEAAEIDDVLDVEPAQTADSGEDQ